MHVQFRMANVTHILSSRRLSFQQGRFLADVLYTRLLVNVFAGGPLEGRQAARCGLLVDAERAMDCKAFPQQNVVLLRPPVRTCSEEHVSVLKRGSCLHQIYQHPK